MMSGGYGFSDGYGWAQRWQIWIESGRYGIYFEMVRGRGRRVLLYCFCLFDYVTGSNVIDSDLPAFTLHFMLR